MTSPTRYFFSGIATSYVNSYHKHVNVTPLQQLSSITNLVVVRYTLGSVVHIERHIISLVSLQSGMATSFTRKRSFIGEKCDELLTCPICLDRYNNPRTILCQHSFCMTCIDQLPRQDDATVDCPVCRKPTQLGEKGASALPAAFNMIMLLEIDDLLKKNSNQECDTHEKREKIIYCKSCCEYICFECYRELHSGHKCDQTDALVKQHEQQMKQFL